MGSVHSKGNGTTEWYQRVATGEVPKHSIVHKFGKNLEVGTTFIPISIGGIYNTVQVGSATPLRIKASGHANDTAAGTGAQEITVEGIDETGAVAIETIATAGASASAVTTTTFIRLYRAFVSGSGSYASLVSGSHDGDIVVENGAGGTDWGTIKLNSFAKSQTEIGAYTIPSGYTGYLISAYGFSDSSKTTNLVFFRREGILDTVAPYQAMRVVFEERAEGGEWEVNIKAPIYLGSACDVGFMAKVDATTAEVDIDFEILLIQD